MAHRVPVMLALILLVGCQDYAYKQQYVEDSLDQGTPGAPVDLLWIIDDSGSMTEEQGLLNDSFPAFATVLEFSGVDFHMGVTSTDVDKEAGVLVGSMMDNTTADLAAEFASAALLGIHGSRDEQPLEAAVLATTSGTNGDFVRSDANLVILIVTDEDDHSREEVTTYVDTLSATKGDMAWNISAIAGDPPEGCHSPIADAVVGTRVIEAVTLTGGVFESLCSADFEAVLSALGLSAVGMTDTFPLSVLPTVDSIEVRVDGVDIYQRDQDGWRYDAGENAIIFDGLAVPRAGQGVLIKYVELLGIEEADTAVAG